MLRGYGLRSHHHKFRLIMGGDAANVTANTTLPCCSSARPEFGVSGRCKWMKAKVGRCGRQLRSMCPVTCETCKLCRLRRERAPTTALK